MAICGLSLCQKKATQPAINATTSGAMILGIASRKILRISSISPALLRAIALAFAAKSVTQPPRGVLAPLRLQAKPSPRAGSSGVRRSKPSPRAEFGPQGPFPLGGRAACFQQASPFVALSFSSGRLLTPPFIQEKRSRAQPDSVSPTMAAYRPPIPLFVWRTRKDSLEQSWETRIRTWASRSRVRHPAAIRFPAAIIF